MTPRDFLSLGRLDSSRQQQQQQGPAGISAKHLGPFGLQIPEGDVSLARLQQMSEQSGFQLACAFTNNYKGFHVSPAASRASAVSAQGFPNVGAYRAATTVCSPHLVPPQLSSPDPKGFLRPLVRPRDADIQHQLCRDSKFLKDNRGTRWVASQGDVLSMKTGSQLRLQAAARAIEALNHRGATSLVMPFKDTLQQQAREDTTFLSLKPPCRPEDADAGASTKLQQDSLRQLSPPTSKSAPLTIFYEGSVNVFDNVSSDRAQAVMLLAASMTSSDTKPMTATPAPAMPALVTSSEQCQPARPRLPELKDLPQARKASLARFLVRRKERCLQKANADAFKKADGDAVENEALNELAAASSTAAAGETKQDKDSEQQERVATIEA